MEFKLFFIFFTVITASYSQNLQNIISGKVIDRKGQPLFGATISIDNNSQASIVDENGNYSINNLPNGKHLIKASYMGFKTEHREIVFNNRKKDIHLNFSLEENTESLQQVRLLGKTQKTKIEEKGFAVNVIETKEASLRNIQTNELLNTTVGVKLRQNGGLGSNVQYMLNGLSGSSVRIFIDGIPISVYGSSFSLNSIPPSMIKRIEVYKGVIPGHLADDALGGAINVVLHKGTKSNFNASVSYGSFNTFQASVNGLYRFDKSGFTIKTSGFHNYSDNDYKVWGGMVKHIEVDGSQTPITAKRFHDAYRSTGGMAQIGFTDVKWADQFFIGMTGSDDYKQVQHGAFMTISPYKGRFLESNALLTNMSYIKKDLLTKGLSVNFNGLYGKRKRIVNDTVDQAYTWKGVKMQRKDFENPGQVIDHKYPWGSQQEGGPTLMNIRRNVASMRTGISYKANKHHKILFNHVYSGLDREDTDEMVSYLENTFKQTSDLYKNIYSLSYELNAFKKRLKLNVFGKHYRQKIKNTQPKYNDDKTEVIKDVYQSDKDYNGYGFAGSFAILENIIVLSSAEKAIRLPNENEVFGDAGDNLIANLGVKPEISMNYNLGICLGKFNIKKHGVTLSTNLFSRNIQDLIGLPANADDSWENDELVQYANFNEKTTSKGIEAQFNYSYNNNFGFSFNFSKLSLKTRNRRGQIVDVPNTPLFTMNGAFRYSLKDFIQKNARLNLFYDAYYTHEFSYKTAQGTNVTGLDAFLVPTQFIQNFGCSYAFPKNRFVLSFDAKNIFNQAAYDNRSVQKPGRAFYIKLNYFINKL
ncbi:TonB-dependent receptor [Wenyingzhuangia sp. chi5]|uniref:TonB-dependent receptor n=1 Tax=Wenyingzhuangia gilva TaxID=3057677 RepID=A0ABT8VQD8_9FLAO|nr:TonB-dependent receptor [Wenyingzhuangia sp. chi5]MDO3694189.1 TonB-dependent receptor [Wenyingzhuangia sp. chi5]